MTPALAAKYALPIVALVMVAVLGSFLAVQQRFSSSGQPALTVEAASPGGSEDAVKSVPAVLSPQVPVAEDVFQAEDLPEDYAGETVTTGVIHGIVVDEDGVTVPGVTVTLKQRDAMGGDNAPAFSDSAKNDADGQFRFENVPLCGRSNGYFRSFELIARQGDRFGRIFVEDNPWLREQFAELPLYRRYSISGIVTDADGAPLAGVMIQASATSPDVPTAWTVWGGSGTTTDAEGRFTALDLLPGMHTLYVTASGFQRVETPHYATGTDDVKVVMASSGTGTIRGRVVREQTGEGLADAQVHATAVDPELVRTSAGRQSTKTGADGDFAFSHLPEGEFNVRLRAAPLALTHQPARVLVDEATPVEDVRLLAADGAAIAGHVRSAATGLPIPWIRVQATAQPPGEAFDGATTNEEGVYHLEGLSAGTYSIEVQGRPFPATAMELTVELGQFYEGVNLLVESSQRVTGRAVDLQGAPVPGATVIVLADEEVEKEMERFRGVEGAYVSAVTDQDGRFSVERYDDRPFRVQAVSDQAISIVRGPFNPLRHNAEDLTLTLEPAASLSGRVVTPEVQDVPRAIIVAVPRRSGGLSIFAGASAPGNVVGMRELDKHFNGVKGTTGLSGRFALSPLLPGAYEIHTFTLGMAAEPNARPTIVNLSPGEATSDVQLVLQTTGGTVQGRLTMHGKPICGQRVQVEAADVDGPARLSSWGTWADMDGRYHITGIAPGHHQLKVIRHVNEGGKKGLREISEYFGIESHETLTFNFDLGSGSSTIAGTVLLNGKPAPGCTLLFRLDDERLSREEIRAQTDDVGEFAAVNLAHGSYDVRIVQKGERQTGKAGFNRSFQVDAIEDETVEVDFTIIIGKLQGTFTGLREGEEGWVALFPGEIVGDNFTFENFQRLSRDIAYRKKLDADGEYAIPDASPGIYTVLGAAFTAAAETNEQRFASMRLSEAVLVEIEEDKTTVLNVTTGR